MELPGVRADVSTAPARPAGVVLAGGGYAQAVSSSPPSERVVSARVLIEHQQQENPYHTTYHLAKYQQYAGIFRDRIKKELDLTVLINKRVPPGCVSAGADARGLSRYPRLGSFELVVELVGGGAAGEQGQREQGKEGFVGGGFSVLGVKTTQKFGGTSVYFSCMDQEDEVHSMCCGTSCIMQRY